MEWKDIATTVGRVAPALGGLLTGPLGVAITAGGLIAQALGTDNVPDAIEKAIVADPAAAIRLRELESAERVQIQALQMQVLAAQLADVQSARSRDVQLQQLGHRNTRADVMVFAAAVGLIACLGTMIVLQGQLPGEVVGIISTVAGIFGACLRDAFQFEFGSSRGSEVKTALLAQADPVKAP